MLTSNSNTGLANRSSAAQRRITKEWAELQADFPPNVEVSPDESNLLHWTGTITGPDESAYKGGKFKIDIVFPNEVSTLPCPDRAWEGHSSRVANSYRADEDGVDDWGCTVPIQESNGEWDWVTSLLRMRLVG